MHDKRQIDNIKASLHTIKQRIENINHKIMSLLEERYDLEDDEIELNQELQKIYLQDEQERKT